MSLIYCGNSKTVELPDGTDIDVPEYIDTDIEDVSEYFLENETEEEFFERILG